MGIAFTSFAQPSAAGGQGGLNSLQRFKARHPLTFTGGGDPMVADHWCNTPKYTLVIFNMFRVFCRHKLNFS